jgi:2-succinyl-6-hydroxy-2,4-cyclohexadiene-1-carboxylate synthase
MKTQINGVTYAFDVMGQGETLLLLHGFTGSRQQWQEIAETLASDYRVISVDLLGHGETDSPADSSRYTIDHAATDLVTIASHLDAGPLHLLGYSMGGRLALYTAIHYADHVRSLLLESASPGLESEAERDARRAQDEALADRIEHEGMDWFAAYWGNLSLWDSQRALPRAIRDGLDEQRRSNHPAGLANSLRGMGTGNQPSLWDNLEALAMPVTLIAGELDTKFVSINEQMQGGIPGATCFIVPGTGHNVHLEQLDKYLAVCRNHLAEAHRR